MNQQDKNRLLDAYQKGTISSEDKRLLELAALEDTFLFQALEGSHDGNISVDTIREQLHKKVKKEHRRTLWVPAVAATLLLVSALMWWNNSSDNMIDSNQQIVQVDQSELESIINIPSEKIQPTSSESETNIQKNSTETITVGGEPTNNNVKHEIIEESEELARKNLNTYLKQKPTVVASGVKETKEIPPPPPAIKEETNVDDSFDEIIAGDLNTEYSPERNPTNVDLILEEDVESEPEITDEEIIAIQNTSVTTRAKPVISKKREKNSQNKQESEAKDYPPLDEIIVTNTTTSSPLMGYKDLKKFIKENKINNLPTNFQKGRVRLKFNVDKRGIPTTFTILQSLNEDMDKHTIELLKNTGKWTPGQASYTVEY